jgi:excisionase family DNA binding protein
MSDGAHQGASVGKPPTRYRRLMTEPEVCEVLRMTRNTVLRERRRGALPYVRLGRNVRYRAEDLIRYIDERVQGEAVPG